MIASIGLVEDIRSVVVNSLSSVALNATDVATATKSDPIMSKVIQFVRQDWPRNSTYSGELACFYARKEDLSEMGGCLLFGERVIIPKALR